MARTALRMSRTAAGFFLLRSSHHLNASRVIPVQKGIQGLPEDGETVAAARRKTPAVMVTPLSELSVVLVTTGVATVPSGSGGGQIPRRRPRGPTIHRRRSRVGTA